MEEISAMNSKSNAFGFRKEDFMADDFSVDKFVSECRKHTSLETMREELGLFLRILQSAMVELINKDYADFVNLSSNLVGLDKCIKNLSTPLGQLKEEIMSVKQRLDESLSSAQSMLTEREGIHKKKIQVNRLMCILDGIGNIEKLHLPSVSDNNRGIGMLSGEHMERIAVEFNQVLFHMNKSCGLQVIQEKQFLVNTISDVLQQHLEVMFLQCIKDCDEESLYKVLRIYSAIDRVKEAESKFRTQIVRPYMRQVVTEDFIAKQGIDKMYSQVLEFIPSNCYTILEVTRGAKRDAEILKGYDFLVNAVWPEIIVCLECIASTVFAPGNPSLFHQNYCASMAFVDKFEHSCLVQTSVKRLREHPDYKFFLNKWNLLVYFQIRFQEIGGFFETALMSAFCTLDNKTSYHLNATAALWHCLKLCWDCDVYLPPLCPNFWKLTLQLVSRYYCWANNAVKMEKIRILNNQDSGKDNSVPNNISEIENTEPTLSIIQLVMLVEDIELLIMEIPTYFKENIAAKLQTKLMQSQLSEEALVECVTSLKDLPSNIGLILVKQLTIQCSQHLRLIIDIPRLYRRTNREVPSKPSNYVTLVFSPLAKFLSETKSLLSPEWKSKWIRGVIDNVTQQCLAMTTDVITSIKKMEDSLKRLKKAREKHMGHTSSGAMSDDDKIRHQLVIDVEHFGEEIESLGIAKTSIQNYQQLMDLVASAMKTFSIT